MNVELLRSIPALPKDLVKQAEWLSRKEPKRPKQSSLRRSISTCYYAVFQCLMLLSQEGLFRKSDSDMFLQLTTRTLEHDKLKKAANKVKGHSQKVVGVFPNSSVPTSCKTISKHLVDLQKLRHDADYNLGKTFTRSNSKAAIDKAHECLQLLNDLKRMDKQALTAFLAVLYFSESSYN